MSEEALAAYLVRGSDPALRSEAVRALLAELVGDRDASLVVEGFDPDGDEPDTAAAADAARTPPFLTDRRVVVLRDAGGFSAEGLLPLLGYLAEPLDTTALVVVAGEGRLPPKLVDAVRSIGRVLDTDAPSNRRARTSWVTERVAASPVRLAPAAVALVEDHLGEDVGRLGNVLEALGSAYGRGSRLEADDVQPFLGEAGGAPPWELTDAIDGGDVPGSIAALHRLLDGGQRHPLVVMATLHAHHARMLRLDGLHGPEGQSLDEASAAKALGLKGSTFPARKALKSARDLGSDGVAEAIRLLATADLDLRGASAWPARLVLEVLVARLSRLRRARRPSGRAGPRRRSGS